MIDLEYAYHLQRTYNGSSLVEEHQKLYRGWLRYSTHSIEARLGLQKVSFGPAQVLRPLAWFDTIDPKSPMNQTDGVEAFRLKVYPSNSLAFWAWIMKGESDTLSWGGRGELSTNLGEWGFTLHQDPTKASQNVGQSPVLTSGSHYQFGVDYRYDGFIGFWFEGAGFIVDNQNMFNEDRFSLVTLGADYTLPLGGGLLIMSETLRKNGWSSNNDSHSNQIISVLMASLPIGMIHNVIIISTLDWDENRIYNYLRWGSTYDRFSYNFMASTNPSSEGNSLHLMLIYNH